MARASEETAAKAKKLKFKGSSLKDLSEFPEDARREAGYQLDRVQNGLEPKDFKAMSGVGRGVYEIRIKDGAVSFACCMWPRLKTPSMCCTAFKRRRRRRRRAISILPAGDMRNW